MKTGVLASYRENILLIREMVLTDEQYVLYQYCINQADFDQRHEKFGMFEFTPREIANDLNCGKDKIGRGIKRLLRVGLLKIVGNKQLQVVEFQRYIPKNAYEITKNKEQVAFLRNIIANVQAQNALLRPKNAIMRQSDKGIASDGDAISDKTSSRVNNFPLRTIDEYRRIKEELGFTALTEDDMAWIDANVTEGPSVPS